MNWCFYFDVLVCVMLNVSIKWIDGCLSEIEFIFKVWFIGFIGLVFLVGEFVGWFKVYKMFIYIYYWWVLFIMKLLCNVCMCDLYICFFGEGVNVILRFEFKFFYLI